MSEETKEVVESGDNTWSALKKTIIGAISTAILAGGTWFTTHMFGGDSKDEHKTEQVAPAAAPVINLSVDNSSKNTASGGGGTTTIIKEKTVEKAAPAKEEKPAKKSETENSPW
jgi:hypothetical protein